MAKAVVAVHLYGQTGPVEMIRGQVHSPVRVVEDAAQFQGACEHDNVIGRNSRQDTLQAAVLSIKLRHFMVTRLDKTMTAAGVEDTIRAVGADAKPNVDLVIIGTGNAEDRLRGLADKVNTDLRRLAVVLAGPMADPAARTLRQTRLVGWVPLRREAWPSESLSW